MSKEKKRAENVKIGDSIKGHKVTNIFFSHNPYTGEKNVNFERGNSHELKAYTGTVLDVNDDEDWADEL